MRSVIASMVAAISLAAFPAYCGNLEELNLYFKNSLPGEAFVATPYGADARFKPKTIWLYLDNFQASPQKPKRQHAWVAASSGEAIYDRILAPLHVSEVSMPMSSADQKTKYGVTAALAGTLSAVDIDAGVGAALSKGVELDVDLGLTEIEYVYYFDMLSAQIMNTTQLTSFNNVLKASYGRDIPVRRVITGALRSKGGSIVVKNTKNVDFSADAELTSFLSKLGFTYVRERNSFDKLVFNEWRYIAYQSRYTDKDGKITGAADAAPVEMTATNLAPFDENSFGSVFVGP